MFSTREYLERKTGPYGVGRLSFMQSLVTEYQDTSSLEAKQQVIANLANFAYDPINYEYIRALNITDLFLDCLDDNDTQIVEYAIGGVCNLCLDKKHKNHIIKNNGIPSVIRCLTSSNEETVLSAITALMFLLTPESKADITSVPVIDAMLHFANSKNPRLKNLAVVFLEDYANAKDVAMVREAQAALVTGTNS